MRSKKIPATNVKGTVIPTQAALANFFSPRRIVQDNGVNGAKESLHNGNNEGMFQPKFYINNCCFFYTDGVTVSEKPLESLTINLGMAYAYS